MHVEHVMAAAAAGLCRPPSTSTSASGRLGCGASERPVASTSTSASGALASGASEPPRPTMAGVRGGMHANRAADPTRLSCSEYAGPKGEGKFRLIERQWMFTATDDPRAKSAPGGMRSDEYKENLGPGSYPNYDARILGAHRPPGDWMARGDRFAGSSGRVTPDMLRTSKFDFGRDFRQHWVKDPGCGNIVLGKDSRFKDRDVRSPCLAGFYDIGPAVDYLRYPGRTVRDQSGRVTPDGTNVSRSVFVSRSERFPDDPAAHLGPGSHDPTYPDEVIANGRGAS
jgi:hypothetical protein